VTAAAPVTEPRVAEFSPLVRRIVGDLTSRLATHDSPLVSDAAVNEELAAQVRAILARAIHNLTLTEQQDAGGPGVPVMMATEGTDVGRRRAAQDIHPAESLAAASVLFEVSLAAVTEMLPGRWPTSAVALSLHHAIMQNVVPAATSYVNVLLDRLSVAHTEERLRISRDLHDRVAHGIAVAQQRLQLSGYADDSRDDDGAVDVRRALDALGSALGETQAIATELRYRVGAQNLQDALVDFVGDAVAGTTPVTVCSTGTVQPLATGVQEEAFIVLRELVHNARRHAQAEEIRIELDWSPESVSVSVRDDGAGFERAQMRPGALGLIGARERAEAVGAELTILTTPGIGTVVTLEIPLAGEVA